MAAAAATAIAVAAPAARVLSQARSHICRARTRRRRARPRRARTRCRLSSWFVALCHCRDFFRASHFFELLNYFSSWFSATGFS